MILEEGQTVEILKRHDSVVELILSKMGKAESPIVSLRHYVELFSDLMN